MTTTRERKIRRERRRQREAKLDKLRKIIRNCIVTIGILFAILAFDVLVTGVLYENPYRSLEITAIVASLAFGSWLFMKAFPEK